MCCSGREREYCATAKKGHAQPNSKPHSWLECKVIRADASSFFHLPVSSVNKFYGELPQNCKKKDWNMPTIRISSGKKEDFKIYNCNFEIYLTLPNLLPIEFWTDSVRGLNLSLTCKEFSTWCTSSHAKKSRELANHDFTQKKEREEINDLLKPTAWDNLFFRKSYSSSLHFFGSPLYHAQVTHAIMIHHLLKKSACTSQTSKSKDILLNSRFWLSTKSRKIW